MRSLCRPRSIRGSGYRHEMYVENLGEARLIGALGRDAVRRAPGSWPWSTRSRCVPRGRRRRRGRMRMLAVLSLASAVGVSFGAWSAPRRLTRRPSRRAFGRARSLRRDRFRLRARVDDRRLGAFTSTLIDTCRVAASDLRPGSRADGHGEAPCGSSRRSSALGLRVADRATAPTSPCRSRGSSSRSSRRCSIAETIAWAMARSRRHADDLR